MTEQSSQLEMPDGLRIQRYVFRPDSQPSGGLILIHGLGDHLSRYRHVARFFTARGLLAVGIDLPGHGLSSGRRGHIPGNWQRLIDLLDHQAAFLRCELDQSADPVGIFAHSFGGFLALDYLSRRPGHYGFAWLSSPLIQPAHNQPAWLIKASQTLGGMVPFLTVDTKVSTADCRESGYETCAETNPELLHRRISVGLGAEMLRRQALVRQSAANLPGDLSLLITQGAGDRVCPPEFSRELYEMIPCAQKAYVEIPGALHEPLHGSHRQEVFEAVDKWFAAGNWGCP